MAMTAFVAFSESPEAALVRDQWAQAGIDMLAQGEDRVYVNFLTSDPKSRVHAAYPGKTWERLQRIKRRYDPENLFRLNKNVTPA